MQSYLAEDMALSEENQKWVRDVIQEAIYPNGFRKAANRLRYWGVLGVCITAFVALIAIAVTLGIFGFSGRTEETLFRGKTEEKLKSIESNLAGINTTLLALRAAQAANLPTDKKNIGEAKAILASAKQSAITLPADVVEQAGKNFVEAASKEPAAWDAALRFAEYRSYLNLALNILPSPGARTTTTIYTSKGVDGFSAPHFSIAGLIPKDKAARFNPVGSNLNSDTAYGNQWVILTGGGLLLDGYEVKNVVFTSVHIVYRGGPLRMENVYFVGCTFDFSLNAHGQDIVVAILSPNSSGSIKAHI